MHDAHDHKFPPEQQLALSYTWASRRDELATFFALDQRMGQIVANTSEPMLGQMRLAWWRDMLTQPLAERPKGDEVLDAVGTHWQGRERDLVELVNAWEVLVSTEMLSQDSIESFATGRAAPLVSLVGKGASGRENRISTAGWRWALADAACRVSNEQERATLLKVGLARSAVGARIPKDLRGLAVLDALALRALKRGGRPLMEGRGAAMVALRAGLFGR